MDLLKNKLERKFKDVTPTLEMVGEIITINCSTITKKKRKKKSYLIIRMLKILIKSTQFRACHSRWLYEHND